MSTQPEKAKRFLELHRKGAPLVMPNPWDAGSAKLLTSLGFEALATTSSGFAGSLGRLDGGVTRKEALEHASTIVGATELPVSADLENCFADEPDEVATTIEMAIETGLAGGSIEDFTRNPDAPIYEIDRAASRVAAASSVAHSGAMHFVLTARCENYLHGVRDLPNTIERLLAYQDAGADVLFAPGVSTLEDIRAIVDAVQRPLSVLASRNAPSVVELAGIGVSRISVGGSFFYASLGAVVDAARELREQGTYGYWSVAKIGAEVARSAFR
ncbi:MAG: isocitrate lyase/PEP mutase family protein [Actinomycetota bacterium]